MAYTWKKTRHIQPMVASLTQLVLNAVMCEELPEQYELDSDYQKQTEGG